VNALVICPAMPFSLRRFGLSLLALTPSLSKGLEDSTVAILAALGVAAAAFLA
jgi:hypothetical protein